MNRSDPPTFVGTYVVWRRWHAAVGLAGLLLATALAVRAITASAAGASMATLLASIAASGLVGGLIGWVGLRVLRRPVRVLVSPRALVLEPVDGGAPLSWTWEELEPALHADDEDGTLELRSARSGALLLGRTSESSMATLMEAIAEVEAHHRHRTRTSEYPHECG